MKKLFEKIYFEFSIIVAVIWDMKWGIIFGLLAIFLFCYGLIFIADLLNSIINNPEKIGAWFGNIIKGFNEAKQ